MFVAKLVLKDVKFRSRTGVKLNLGLVDILGSPHFDNPHACKALTLLVLNWSCSVVFQVCKLLVIIAEVVILYKL